MRRSLKRRLPELKRLPSPSRRPRSSLPRLATRRGVTYLGSTYVPSDESCFCRFEAANAEQVRDVNEVAGVPFARIVAATELAVAQSGPSSEGDSA
jgi:Protein of unknown function (DUF4242)